MLRKIHRARIWRAPSLLISTESGHFSSLGGGEEGDLTEIRVGSKKKSWTGVIMSELCFGGAKLLSERGSPV